MPRPRYDPGGWCGRRDSNPHSTGGNGFSYRYGFRRLPERLAARPFASLDYPFAMAARELRGFRRCPSSLYTFRSQRSGLARDQRRTGGTPPRRPSPTLSSSTPRISPEALKFSLKSVASTGSATSACRPVRGCGPSLSDGAREATGMEGARADQAAAYAPGNPFETMLPLERRGRVRRPGLRYREAGGPRDGP